MGKFKRGAIRILDGNTFAFVAGARQSSQLPVPATFMRRLWLHLQGTLTITVVTVPGNVHADGPANLIALIELLIDGYPLKVGQGAHFFRVGQRYDRTDGVNNGLVSGAAGVYPFEALIPVSFELPSAINPFDTILDGRTVRNMTLNLTWGTTASLIVGNTSTLALTLTTCAVYVEETDAFALKGTPWLFHEFDVNYPGILTNAATRLLLPYNNASVMRSIMLKASDAAAAQILSDAIVNSASLRINGGEDIPFNTLAGRFQQAYAQQYFELAARPQGYYFLELAEGGRVLKTGLGAGVQPNAINSLDVIANTTVGGGATAIDAHICELLPPRS